MKTLLRNIFLFSFFFTLFGCSVNWVPNNTNYTRSHHTHNEYCGHTGYIVNNNDRINTNLHYYDPKTGKRKHYDDGINTKRIRIK